jgi:hypothetical protein
VGVTSDSITIDPDQGSADLTIPRRNLDQLEVSTGPRRQTLAGAGIGLAAGAGAGAAWGATMEPGFVGRSGNIVVGSMFIGAIGLALGAVVGTLTLTDRWVRVEVDGQPGTGLQGFRSETTIRVGLTFKP